jgi:nifR3 family TIM-barrel protein
MIKTEASFSIRDLHVHGDLILAPMRGYSDLPYRTICRSLGSAMSYTSFVGAIEILSNDETSWKTLEYEPQERPVVFQIYDNNVNRLLEAAKLIRSRNPDMIDVNMGCSVRKVAGRGAGAGLLRDLKKLGKIIHGLTSTLDIPVSAKIRLGWDQHNRNYIAVAKAIEDNGGALIAVHARTRDQAFRGEADWDAIAEIKNAVSIPIIGNGDVKTVEDIDHLKIHTGCDAIMIGRAAKGNPWIFQRRNREEVSNQEVSTILFRHLDRMIKFYGQDLGLLRFRKHLAAYIKLMQISHDRHIALLTSPTPSDLSNQLAKIGLERKEHPRFS